MPRYALRLRKSYARAAPKRRYKAYKGDQYKRRISNAHTVARKFKKARFAGRPTPKVLYKKVLNYIKPQYRK